MLNFPDSPTAGTVFGAWRYDGTKWGAVSGVSGGGSAGDITAVLAGAGLSGGGTEGDVSIALAVPVTVARGGTGATDAVTARTNLGAAPLAGPVFTGDPQAPTPATADNDTSIATTAYVKAQGYLTPPANLTTQVTGVLPVANGGSGSSTAAAAPWVEVGGDTMTGALAIAPAAGHAQFTLNKAASGSDDAIYGSTGGLLRWGLFLGNGAPESGGAGSDFLVGRYNDAGVNINYPLSIARATGGSVLSPAVGGSVDVRPGSAPLGSVTAALKIGYGGGGSQYGMSLRPQADSTIAAAFYNVSDGIVGNIGVTATATTYNTTSDMELKEDLKTFDAGNIIDSTNVYDFAWKETGERAYGVIAQQAVEVYPQVVTHLVTDATEWWGVDYSKYVPVLLQELKALRARVAALEGLGSVTP